MSSNSELNFIRQQGFEDASASSCEILYPALMFQPIGVGIFVIIGTVFQLPAIFLTLAGILLFSALVPHLNPFDLLYNKLISTEMEYRRFTPAPEPRRFSQALAGTVMLIVGISLILNWFILAIVFNTLIILALIALIFGKFCAGSYIYHFIRGRLRFANETLPWNQQG